MEPFILLDRKDFIVFSGSLESTILGHSILSIDRIKPIVPNCIRSVISNIPDACDVVENFLAIFSTKGKNLIIKSSLVYCEKQSLKLFY